MSPEDAILTISLFAAFVDGAKDDREREHIRRFSETLGDDARDLPRIYQDVLLQRVTLKDAAQALEDLGQRQFAYEMAVSVCDADGRQCDVEKRFLGELKSLLGLGNDAHSSEIEKHADTLAEAAVLTLDAPADSTVSPEVNDAEIDSMILNYAVLNGALELLPQSWASVAIVPLQMKMVYRVGRAHGHELDAGHIKEFLATVGVGLTSQTFEQLGRKLLGGVLARVAGKGAGKVGRAATGVTFSFATTYALGQVAKRYYGGGRQLSTQLMHECFQSLLAPAKQLQSQYMPQIEQKAAGLDVKSIMSLVRGAGSTRI